MNFIDWISAILVRTTSSASLSRQPMMECVERRMLFSGDALAASEPAAADSHPDLYRNIWINQSETTAAVSKNETITISGGRTEV